MTISVNRKHAFYKVALMFLGSVFGRALVRTTTTPTFSHRGWRPARSDFVKEGAQAHGEENNEDDNDGERNVISFLACGNAQVIVFKRRRSNGISRYAINDDNHFFPFR
jgi:hypothetical protein